MRQLLFGIGLVLFAWQTQAQSTISVQVDDGVGAIQGAEVRATGPSTVVQQTDQYGMALLLLDNGVYTLTVRSGFHQMESRELVVTGTPQRLTITLKPENALLQPVNVAGVLARKSNPIAFTEMKREDIAKVNEGRDIPFILEQTPGLVTTTDAGAGIGYTGMRIRGSDQTRINVTVNGVPINDAESQQVFWVNMPDLASSLDRIQVQRGLGTSTNGAGAFGASVHMETSGARQKAYTELDAFGGSFNTSRLSLRFGTGLLENGLSIDGRFSQILSDGYIDRASSELQSYYLNISKVTEKTTISLLTFGGRERTYQSWFGISPEQMAENPTFNPAGAIMGTNAAGESSILGYYDNQVDNYRQDHYQLVLAHQFSSRLQLNAALHYTFGEGYYEDYRVNRRPSEFGMPNLIRSDSSLVSRTDFIRRLWLRNHFGGGVYSLVYALNNSRLTLGGGANYYKGFHFGEALWVREVPDMAPFQWYDNEGAKVDANQFVKAEIRAGKMEFFGDVQIRLVQYEATGLNRDFNELDINEQFLFFNPKAGFTYEINKRKSFYGYVGFAGREPTRRDIIEAQIEGFELRPEYLLNFESGYRYEADRTQIQVNAYYMDYTDQLVLTGQISDTGRPIRRNVGRSYRAGIEALASMHWRNKWRLEVNGAFSQNRNLGWTETVAFDENWNPILEDFGNTPIALSPDVVAGAVLTYRPIKNLGISWNNRYVSRQYLNNLGRESLSLPAYWISDLRMDYQLNDRVAFRLFINNIFKNQVFFDAFGSGHFATNGGTFNFPNDNRVVEYGSFVFPVATTNFLFGVMVKL
jgi:iron complex outermembrane receptor protein